MATELFHPVRLAGFDTIAEARRFTMIDDARSIYGSVCGHANQQFYRSGIPIAGGSEDQGSDRLVVCIEAEDACIIVAGQRVRRRNNQRRLREITFIVDTLAHPLQALL